eukprot:863184_1
MEGWRFGRVSYFARSQKFDPKVMRYHLLNGIYSIEHTSKMNQDCGLYPYTVVWQRMGYKRAWFSEVKQRHMHRQAQALDEPQKDRNIAKAWFKTRGHEQQTICTKLKCGHIYI